MPDMRHIWTSEKINPYRVPEGYFDKLLPAVMEKIKALEAPVTAADELEQISPLLAGMEKTNPYQVPHNYFGNLEMPSSRGSRLVRMNNSWLKYAAAAVVTIGIFLAGALLWKKNTDLEAMPLVKFEKKLGRELQRMSDTELVDFFQYTEAGMNGDEKVSVNPADDVKELLQDIPESELKEFIEETSDLNTTEAMN